MADYWAKVYIEILDDPKIATMPDRLWRRTIELFLFAKELNKGGHLPETKQIAWRLRMPTDELDLDMKQIAMTNIIQPEPGGWFITKFAQRQAASSDAERKRKQRERDQRDQYYGHEDVTEQSRNVRQSTENRLTETETETETKVPPPPSDSFDSIREQMNSFGILVTGKGDADAINELIALGATLEDLKAGFDWKVNNNGGKPLRYASQLIGPTKTAMAKRLQDDHKPHDKAWLDQHGYGEAMKAAGLTYLDDEKPNEPTTHA